LTYNRRRFKLLEHNCTNSLNIHQGSLVPLLQGPTGLNSMVVWGTCSVIYP